MLIPASEFEDIGEALARLGPLPTVTLLGRIPHAAPHEILVPGGVGRKLTGEAAEILRRWIQPDGGLEAGGMLIGRYTEEGGMIVDTVTEPLPLDIREPRAFCRLDPGHQERVNLAWTESDGRRHYMGEWHTHSEANPEPSALDLATWRFHVAGDLRGKYSMLAVIVGQAEIAVWEVAP